MSGSETQNDPLAQPRQRIDQLDQQIVELLNERAKVVQQIGRIKNEGEDAPIYAPDREQRVLDRVRAANAGPLPDACLEAIWRELMSGSFALERRLRIGFLGPVGSFSHLAASKQFGSSVGYEPAESITGVFHAVESGRIDLGLAPIENSIGGGIHETLDCFVQTSARICAEVVIAVHHHLLSHAERDGIERVYSRPEVFEQCRGWLSQHLPAVEQVATTSTARAAERAAEEPTAAAIGSHMAGREYGLPLRAENIEDNPNNLTRFFVIGHQSSTATGDDKTAILFTTRHKPGALANVINDFARHGVNLTHIDKRPSRRATWEYYFFVDCEGHADDAAVTAALEDAGRHCMQLTVLGSFPRAKNVLA